jgi:hypothetical protein
MCRLDVTRRISGQGSFVDGIDDNLDVVGGVRLFVGEGASIS